MIFIYTDFVYWLLPDVHSKGTTTLLWWSGLHVSMTHRATVYVSWGLWHLAVPPMQNRSKDRDQTECGPLVGGWAEGW